jgi:phosphomannomutase
LSFSLTQDGTGLWARDEKDRVLTPEQCFLLTERIQLEGEAGSVFLPPDAPAAAERMGRGLGKVLPLEENRGAAQNQRCLRDGTFAACRILDRISRTGESLAQLADALPECVLHREELALKRERSTIMRRLTERFPDAVSTSEGLRISLGEGSVFLSPRSRLSALKISAEAASAEAAEELCIKMREQVRRLEFRDESF